MNSGHLLPLKANGAETDYWHILGHTPARSSRVLRERSGARFVGAYIYRLHFLYRCSKYAIQRSELPSQADSRPAGRGDSRLRTVVLNCSACSRAVSASCTLGYIPSSYRARTAYVKSPPA